MTVKALFFCICLAVSSGQLSDIITEDFEDFDIDEKIVGGIEAELGEYPPIVFLLVDIGDVEVHGCGASIINENFILSAGHCCEFELPMYEAIGGVHNFSNPEEVEHWQRRKIARLQVHPNFEIYNESSYAYDLCVLELSAPFDLTSDWLGMTTFTYQETPVGAVTTGYGWGRTVNYGDYGPRSPVLLKVNFTVVPFDECNTAWNATLQEESMLCAYAPDKSPCHGDSGAPLIWHRTMGEGGGSVQAGVISWGYECGHPDYPPVFADVSKNLNWILLAAAPNCSESRQMAVDGSSFLID